MFEANPILTRTTGERRVSGQITFNSIINRTGILLLVAMVTYAIAWIGLGATGIGTFSAREFMPIAIVVSIAGFILGLVISFTQSCNPVLISIYAATQGFYLGVISRFVDAMYPGIAFETASATFIIFFLVLGAYRLRVLRATPLLSKIIVVGLCGVAALYLMGMVGRLFGYQVGFLYGNGNVSILISVAIVCLAAISFVMDFAQAEQAVEYGVADEYSWRISFGLLVGLVYLYINILALLSKTRSRSRD